MNIFTEKNSEQENKYSNKNRTEPQPETVSILKKKLKYEIELYEWIKKRFYEGLDSMSHATNS